MKKFTTQYLTQRSDSELWVERRRSNPKNRSSDPSRVRHLKRAESNARPSHIISMTLDCPKKILDEESPGRWRDLTENPKSIDRNKWDPLPVFSYGWPLSYSCLVCIPLPLMPPCNSVLLLSHPSKSTQSIKSQTREETRRIMMMAIRTWQAKRNARQVIVVSRDQQYLRDEGRTMIYHSIFGVFLFFLFFCCL